MSAFAPWIRVAVAMTAVGWGANHFAGLLAVYRSNGHSEAFVSVAVGIYAAGLIPALLAVAAIGDRVDHRTPVRAAVVLSAVGTALLVAGADHDALLHVGRFVAGAATGIVLAPGTAWLMDLSRATPGAGPRRATVSLSLGFGGGPLVVGLIGQWSPHPEVTPYAAHLLLSVAAAVVVWTAPMVHAPGDAGAQRSWRRVGRALATRDFAVAVPATAPWVFGAASTAFAVVPGALPVATLPVAAGAVVLGVTLFGGIAVQPVAKRLEARRPGRSLVVGMATAAVGLLVTATAFVTEFAPLQFVVAVVLGAAYGLLLVGGLSRVELVSHPDDRTRINAVFYTFSYLGFAAPYAFVLLTDHLMDRTTVMLAGAAVAAVTALVVALVPPRPADSTP